MHVGAITVDAILEVGEVSAEITVTSNSDLLQTESSEKSLILTTSQLTELPNVGHNWWNYTLLIPGANPGKGSPARSAMATMLEEAVTIEHVELAY